MAKEFKTRIQHKYDTEANWANATFSPLKGELIIYGPDNNHPYRRFKVGDGVTPIGQLPFVGAADVGAVTMTEVEAYINEVILGGEW